MVEAKSRFDRVKESVRLLKELIRVGISEDNQGYQDVKDVLDLWIFLGEEIKRDIVLTTYRRTAVLTLPVTADKAAEIVLKRI
jgi:hypothetical protein